MPHHDPFADLLNEPADTQQPTSKPVPNVQPTITSVPYRLAIIGEAPGKDEVERGVPFVGYSGQLLDRFLSRFSIIRDACFIGNVCQQRPLNNKIAAFDWDGPEISSGLTKLQTDLQMFRPNICLLLGGSALHAFKESPGPVKKRKTPDGLVFQFPNAIGDWRGSFFAAHMQSPLPGVKCIASYHPAACLRQYEWTPLLMMDISRAMAEATSGELVLPQRQLLASLSFEQTIAEMDKLITTKPAVGTDIEGFWGHLRCISFAPKPDYAFIVPFTTMSGQDLWSFEQEFELMKRMVQILADPKIVKVWQNGLYDRFVFQYGFNIVVRGTSRDIMLKHWELYSELEKKLGVQASLYTREPFYKEERESDDRETFWKYCCRDSALTIEIDTKLDKWLSASSKQHYLFNESLICSLLYMQRKGIAFDKQTAEQRLVEIQQRIYELQRDLDLVSGFGLTTTDVILLRSMVRDTMCFKRDSSQPKKEYTELHPYHMAILQSESPVLVKSYMGQLSIDLGIQLNVDSTVVFKKFLYETLSLPEQTDPKTGKPTSDYEALQTLLKWCKESDKRVAKSNTELALKCLPLAIEIGELKTRSEHLTSMIRCSSDFNDGRVHSFYNEVGSETGRVTCGKLFKKYGYPLQTVADENELKPIGHPLHIGMRDLLIADDGCYLAKCDLKGADGWTVGANLAALGDGTMLDDLRFGLKPASVLCYASRHGPASIIGKTRPELVELCREVKKSDWDYFAYKQCIWGFCYLMGVKKAVQHVFNVSEGTVSVKESDMQLAKDMLFRRYSIQLWHHAMEKKLFSQPYPPKLVSPSGHVRMFFARKTDIVGQALAHEPQSITTYATNRAVFNLWNDPDNRVILDNKCKLRIEPLHQVHDEMVVQFRKEDTEWAVGRIKQYFNNPIVIAGITVTIPYDGAYGTNWSMDSKSKVGTI